MFKKVLIANRGEIALRVMRALRQMGIQSVAVYSEADAGAPHVEAADESFCIGPAPAAESYLRADKIIEAARKSGAEAIHPGYGFLSESAAFAESCEKAGLVFIGPTAEAMRQVGDKASARAVAEAQKVPVVPGARDLTDDAAVLKAAKKIGVPLLLKASAGGGGKGMRLVRDLKDVPQAAASARREAQASFGDDALIVEKYLRPVRHVEVQILGDGRGRVVALGERECSLQRRHQKIIEESPSPSVDAALRARLQKAACRLTSAVHYRSAGTVEFLLDEEKNFYFLEVNARLQVEHPVTEAVTGLDLVKLQIETAATGALTLRQEDVALKGHAIEARLCAEDPEHEFLPSTGKILRLQWLEMENFRVDTGIREGSPVLPWYDPMLAKLIAWAPEREEARRKLLQGLRQSVLLGISSNLPFLADLLESEIFRTSATFTHSVEDWMESRPVKTPKPEAALFLAAALAMRARKAPLFEATPEDGEAPSPWETLGRWRLAP